MKKFITLSILMLAFFTNAKAYEHKIVERHSFRIMHPEDFGPLHPTCHWGGWYGSVLQDIEQTYDWNGTTTHVSYKSWLTNEERFLFENTGGWQITKNDRTDLGYGLVNTADGYKAIAILNLKEGDRVRFEYYRNAAGQGDLPYFMLDNADFGTARGTHKTKVGDDLVDTDITQGLYVYGTEDIVITTAGNLHINCPSKMLLREITITYSDENYQKATYDIDEVHDTDGNLGYKYTITGPGVLEEKRGAVPYITMRFGHDNDMTIVKNFGNGIYGASCIVDPSNDLDISHDNVKLTANYKKRYQNQNGEYFRFPEWLSGDEQFIAGDAAEQESVHQLAQQEVNALYGREWTVFETNNIWNENADWVTARSRSYKWGDDFENTWPLYGTYFYFFPEVQGKLSVKFYCEGNEEHMPFWWKAQDGVVVDQFVTGQNNTGGGKVYEYNDINVVRGGAYYLCANPTLIGREHPVVRLMSYQFIPTFRVEPLYKVVENGTEIVTGACEIIGGPFAELNGNVDTSTEGQYKIHVMENGQQVTKMVDFKINGENAPLVKCLGNIESCVPVIATRNGKQYLDITNITYKTGDYINKGGAIVVNICCDAGKAAFVLTIAYEAAEAEWAREDGKDVRVGTSTEVKRWDFFSNELAIGQYKNGSGTYPEQAWKDSPKLYKEVHKFDGMTTDWTNTYVNPQLQDEPIFKSVYDMEADNADMLAETEGLLFITESNLLGIYNENETSTSDQFNDRYIGLMGPGELDMEDHPRKMIIPFLKAGDRIVIKMGSYGNCDSENGPQNAILKITGATDAVGTAIASDYVIGGSGVIGNGEIEDMSQPYGEYHFISTGPTDSNQNGDFTLEVKDADLLKIYSIVIYKSSEILTENQLKGLKPEVTFTDDDATGAEETIDAHVRYHGFEEISTFDDIDQLRGNLSFAKDDFDVTESDTEPYCTISTTVKKGEFGSVRAKMEVLTKDNNNTYVTDYVPGALAVGLLEKVKDGYPYTWDFTDLLKITDGNDTYIYDAIDFEKTSSNLLADYKGWEAYNGQSLRNAPKNASGILFADGGQLYAKNQMFAEVAGIGFKRSTETIEDAKTLNRSVRIRDNALVLNCNEDGKFHKMVIPKVDADAVIYVRATPIENAKFKALCSKDGTNGAAFDKTLTVGDDKVFIMKNNAKQDVELWLNGYEIHKIAVSRDPKKIGSTGYATESRNHVIDHTLTEYFTGLPIKAYQAELSTDKTKVTLSEVEFLKAATTEGDKTGCVLYNKNGGAVNIIDNGFHLFVPDMHDKGTTAITNNVLKAYLDDSQGNVKSEGDVTSFVLSAKVYDRSSVGLDTHTYLEGKTIGFYKVDPVKGAKLASNSAYLQLGSTSQARVLMFFGDMFGEIPTSIETVEPADEEKAVWHNLNGQVINAPEKAGIYIRNGKKVVVK